MSNIKSKLYAFTIVAVFLFSSSSIVSAQNRMGFAVSPPSFEINANPGDEVKNSIKLENVTDVDLILNVEPKNFVIYGEGGQVALTEEDLPVSINKWLIFDQDTVVVPARKSAIFNFTLKVPQVTEPGTHYGAISFSTSVGTNPVNGASVVQEIGVVILIRIPGEVVEEAQLIEFKSSEQTYTKPEISLNALVENTGTVHIKPTGIITITDIFGNTVQTIEITPRNILPNSRRLFDQTAEFNYIGIFKADIKLFYKAGEKMLTSQINFVALNTDRLVPIAVGVGGVILFYVVFRKRINKAIKIIVKG